MFSIHEAEKEQWKGGYIEQREGIVDMRGFLSIVLFQGVSIVCFRKRAFGGSGYRAGKGRLASAFIIVLIWKISETGNRMFLPRAYQ